MNLYKPKKGVALYELLAYVILGDLLAIYICSMLNSYLEFNLIRMCIIVFSLYCILYILMLITLKYEVKEDEIIINSLFGLKKVNIPFKDINGYYTQKDNIKGIKLSGVGKGKFSFGRSVIEGVGITYMFITSSKEVIYLHTDEMSYGISPENFEKFKSILETKGIKERSFKTKINKVRDLYKEKSFLIPFIVVTLMIIFITLNPFILYLMQRLPSQMPIAFNAKFVPTVWGPGKLFAFRQMAYGAMNMVILVCMQFASYFCAKYHRKSAYKYIYIALICSATFLFIQIQILNIYL
ncbi:PH domain-containing protein [Clostridium fallax]|uniref:PH domain-containing protein n=1 Tax=Clostridium fallax TaxID=1533 RepID=A0A1M4YPS1_9CLOT|nr:PH domain-containing protein [Clostridium fallax]SHF07678.1 PH domain-containing protein [Clostridium fallax]SQB07522.1 membrane protein [Clostridium fallax]